MRVRFALSGSEGALEPAIAQRYVRGLASHMEAVALAESNMRSEDEEEAQFEAFELLERSMPYLVVEDFGTRGLVGGIKANSEYERDNAFWGFFRSIGISPHGADADSGGSWGLGKWVFPDASRINAFIGLTQPDKDPRGLVMGQAMFKTHTIMDRGSSHHTGSSPRDPRAWMQTGFPMPLDSNRAPVDVERFARDFKLERSGDAGLSVVVPHPKAELTAAAISRAVVVQWFVPIVSGHLVVVVASPDGTAETIDRNTIDDFVRKIDESERDDESAASLQKAIDLARSAVRPDVHPPIELRATLRSDILSGQDIEDLRQRFDQGERLAFQINTRVTQRSKKDPISTSFRVYLERDDDLAQGHDYFIRGNLRIPQAGHIKGFHARALVLVDGESQLGPPASRRRRPGTCRMGSACRASQGAMDRWITIAYNKCAARRHYSFNCSWRSLRSVSRIYWLICFLCG